MGKQTNIYPISPLSARRSRSQASRKSHDKSLTSVATSGLSLPIQVTDSIEARRRNDDSLTRIDLSPYLIQDHLPLLLRSYTRPCSSIYAWCVVSSNKKLWVQLPTILNEIKNYCRGFKPLGDNIPSQSLNGEGGIPSLTKTTSKRPSGSSQANLQNGVIERVSFLITVLFPAATNHSSLKQSILAQSKSKSKKEIIVTPKERRKLWKVLMRNISNTFPMLLSAARTDLMSGTDPELAALLLSLLYNLLQALRGKPILKKVIELCIMLGLYKICTSILMAHTSPRVFYAKCGNVGEMQLYYRCRVIEAVALIMTLANHFNSKGHIVIRVTHILERLLYSLSVVVDFLDLRLRDFLDALDNVVDSDKAIGREAVRERLLQIVENTVRLTSFLGSACTHLCMAIFSAAKSSNNTNKLGAKCVGVCAKLIAILSRSLYLDIPNRFCQVFATQSYDSSSMCKLPEGSVENDASQNTVPPWVLLWLSSMEVSMFWAVALLQRVCQRCKAHIACSMGAHKHNVLLSMYTVLWTITQDIGKGVENREASERNLILPTFSAAQWEHRMCVVRATLIAIDTLLGANRKLGLEELHAVGGVASLVKLVLQLPFNGVNQWCQCYILCCSFYGLSLLPSSSENESAYTVNSRVPMWLFSPLGDRFPGKEVSTSFSRVSIKTDDNELSRGLALGAKPPPASQSQLFVVGAGSSGNVPLPEKGLNVSGSMPPAEKLMFTDTSSLLPVDQCPAWFSTELNNGFISPETEMPHEDAIKLPWLFTDPPLPQTNCYHHHTTDELMEPLEVSSDSQRIEILVHHIKRLLLLDGTSDDASEDPTCHHRYCVVYDRTQDVEEGVKGIARDSNEDVLKGSIKSDTRSCARTPGGGSSITFRSNFPSGNLQRAVCVRDDEYDLVLSWDTATNSFTQWFCFSVSGYEPGKTYRFNIINMEKNGSMFNEGQRVLLLHDTCTESFSFPLGNVTNTSKMSNWQRAGECIYYFPNPYSKPTRLTLRDRLQHTPSCATTHTRSTNQSVEAKSKKQPYRSRRSPLCKHLRRDSTTITANEKSSSASSYPVFGKKVVSSSCAHSSASETSTKTYFTLSFKVTMPTEAPHKVYIANCFPYTYSEVVRHLRRLSATAHIEDNNLKMNKENGGGKPGKFTIQQLCLTPGGLPVPFVTATALYSSTERRSYTPEEIRRRPVILLTARVHPGESNSSWMMHGILEALLAPDDLHTAHHLCGCTSDGERLHQVVDNLLNHFVFKIIPILNPDGVVMGNHRCSIFGADLNRDYLNPSMKTNPVVYSLKQLLHHMITTEQRSIILYTDFHGHSRAKNFMIYGCTEEAVSSLNKKGEKKGMIPVRDNSITHPSAFAASAATVPLAGEGCCNDPKGSILKEVSPEKFFPILLGYCCPSFSLPQCLFSAQKCKRTTGRLVTYMQFGIRMSYTVEASMMGGLDAAFKAENSPLLCLPNGGSFNNNADRASLRSCKDIQTHYSQNSFINMGRGFLIALNVLCLLYMNCNLNAMVSVPGADASAENTLVGADLPQEVRQLIPNALVQLCAAGNGKELPRQNLLVDPPASPAPFLPTIAAGSYSLLTRAERRSTQPTGGLSSVISAARLSSLHGATMEYPQSVCSITAAQLQEVMDYLFARCHHVEEDIYSDLSDRQSDDNEDGSPSSFVSSPPLWPSQTLHESRGTGDEELSDSAESTLNDGSVFVEAVERDGIAANLFEDDDRDENAVLILETSSMEMEGSNNKDEDDRNTEYAGDFNDVSDNDSYIPTSVFMW
ncbi:unnamed protein product [Phytomonas sp. EM1]|nr:unnamed protein product [Phytomonas sp. EM1]|eukprot:CCW63041.1 unnamed protein product [Phytomonas sp. isolate EM1]